MEWDLSNVGQLFQKELAKGNCAYNESKVKIIGRGGRLSIPNKLLVMCRGGQA